MKYLYVMIFFVFVVGCGDSDFNDASMGQQSSGNVLNQQMLPVVLQAGGGLFRPNDGEVTVTFTDIQSDLMVGTNGEGGTTPTRDFLSAQSFSRENSRTAQLSYRVGADSRLVPLEIVDVTFQDDSTATVTAIIPAVAQDSNIKAQGTGSMRVTVKDAEGDPLPGCLVKATSSSLSLTRMADTNSSGIAILPGLPPVLYSVQVEQVGFKTGVANIQVRIGQSTPVDFTLQLANQEESFDSAELVIDPPT